jgi:hypothetical protein
MRSIPFREVLWSVAYELGYDPSDPNTDFQVNEAVTMANFANAFVRRLWPSKDWPEWTFTEPRAPDSNHIVPYETNGVGAPDAPLHAIGTVRKVLLADPKTTPGRELDTHFELMPEGVHCGFEHGPQVWIKFLPPCPQFSADQWDSNQTYRRNALIYSRTDGETYRSKSGGNIGNEPSEQTIPLGSDISQTFVAAVPATAGVNAKIRFLVQPPNLVIAGAVYTIMLRDSSEVDHSFAYTLPASPTVDILLNGLIAAAAASADSFINTLVVTKDTPNAFLFVEANFYCYTVGGSNAYLAGPPVQTDTLGYSHLQIFSAGNPGSAAVPQRTTITLPDPAVFGLYEVTIIDSANQKHSFQYDSVVGDDNIDILNGLKAAFDTSTDMWFDSATVTPDFTLARFIIETFEIVSVNADVIAHASPWWEKVSFPFDLMDQVVRGVYANMLKKSGQTDKGTAEEQVVPTEDQVVTSSLSTGEQTDALTTQQITQPRYKT